MIGTMYIDGTPLKNYGAVLSNWNPGTPSISNMITPGEDYSFPVLLHSEITPKALTARVHIIGKNYAEASRKMSALILALNKTTDLQMPDGFYYRSVLTEVSDLEWTNRHIAEFTLAFQSVQHGPYISISPYTAGTPIYYSGTAPAGAKIEFDAPEDMQDMTVSIGTNEIQLITIPSDAHIVLNGIEKIITQNGENKFADTNLVDFPALEPSETAYAIQVSKPVSNLSVGYYPTYI